MNALTTATSGTAFFDPIDTLMDKMGHAPQLYSRVMESMAWMLDASCISQARTILFGRYAEADKDVDNAFQVFCLDVHSDLKHESLYEDQTPEHVLAILLALRHEWHDAAGAAAAADDRDYNPKSLREQLEGEKPSKATVGTRVNYQLMAKIEANGDAALEKRLYDSMLLADEAQAADRANGNKTLMPTVLEILRTVQTYAAADARFDMLPLTKQRMLTNFALGAIDRTSTDCAKRMKSQPIAFARLFEAGHQAKIAINAVIKAKYNDIGELENTSTPMSGTELAIGRNAKRVACSID
jgi:hypothetical protein